MMLAPVETKKVHFDLAPDFEQDGPERQKALTHLNFDTGRIPAELAVHLARVEAPLADIQRDFVDLQQQQTGGFGRI